MSNTKTIAMLKTAIATDEYHLLKLDTETNAEYEQKRKKIMSEPIVIQNEYGNYGILIEGKIIGNYGTFDDALRIAELNK